MARRMNKWPGEGPAVSGNSHEVATVARISAIRGSGLAEGMGIRAAVEARLLGLRLLTLAVDAAVMPAEVDSRRKPHVTRSARQGALGLTEAAPGTPLADGVEAEHLSFCIVLFGFEVVTSERSW